MAKKGKEKSDGNFQKGIKNNNNTDLNNIDMTDIASLLNNVDLSKLMSMFNELNAGLSNKNSNDENTGNTKPLSGANKKFELLNAMKPMFNADRSQMIDIIMQIYTISRILKK